MLKEILPRLKEGMCAKRNSTEFPSNAYIKWVDGKVLLIQTKNDEEKSTLYLPSDTDMEEDDWVVELNVTFHATPFQKPKIDKLAKKLLKRFGKMKLNS